MYRPREIENIIIPSCLKVDKAIIFFRSNSNTATIPDINIVRTEIGKRIVATWFSNKNENRIRRYTPAVTNVEEWTRAETGVGAAMAAGSHAEKGIWALLVIAARTTSNANQ